MADDLPTPATRAVSNSAVKDFLAGAVGGASQVLVGQPLDTIKTRAQIAPHDMFKGPMDVAAQTLKNEGVLALYKGMLSPLIGIAGVNSLLFAAYSYGKRLISPYPELSLAQTAGAGAFAGAVNAILASPVEMFKIRMQGQFAKSGGKDYKSLSQVIRETYQIYGLRHGIMRGFWVTMIKEMPAYAAFYSCFEATKRRLARGLKLEKGQTPPTWSLLLAGSTGGIGYWLASYPLDVIKSRVQMADKPPTGGILYIPKTIAAIYKIEGSKPFFRGLSTALIRSVPAAASTLTMYTLTEEWLSRNTSL